MSGCNERLRNKEAPSQPESCQFTRTRADCLHLILSSYWAQKHVEATSALSISCVKKPMQKGGHEPPPAHRVLPPPNCSTKLPEAASEPMTLRCCMGDYCYHSGLQEGGCRRGGAMRGSEFLGLVENMQRKEGLSASAA